jgi:hypothetical protein
LEKNLLKKLGLPKKEEDFQAGSKILRINFHQLLDDFVRQGNQLLNLIYLRLVKI